MPVRVPVPGEVLGGRYEILQVLGVGGMGTVYKARDREVDRFVALKVIRPELLGQASIVQRFKQELILARQIAHKNVVRIFDLGSADGLRFIAMEYVEGATLEKRLESERLSPEAAARIVRDVCRALEAAHSEGVIHRDLKPQNIMIDSRGKVLVMDFGLARSAELSALTQTGGMIGTPAYMSPEQAKGVTADQRSDIFSLGIIFYEMLTGTVPFSADTVLGSLFKRTQENAPPPRTIDANVPQALSTIVQKCLAIDPAHRYQTATELISDLDVFLGDQASAIMLPVQRRGRRWKIVSAALAMALVAAVVTAIVLRNRVATAPKQRKPVSVVIADFNNGTGEPVFEGTLEPMVNFALEGASFITVYSRGQAKRVAAELGQANRLDEATARLIAVREGLNTVVSGDLAKQGNGYAVSLRALDAVTGKALATSHSSMSSKEKVLSAVPKLTAPIRKALGDSTPESVQLAAIETFTAGSLEAVHEYAVAQDLVLAAKYDAARSAFLKVVELDPNFGRAYAGLAIASFVLGLREESEKYSKLALSHLDRMTERERYRTRGGYYLRAGDNRKCIEEFNALVSQYPSDTSGLNNLALCYTQVRQMPKAIEQMRRAVEVSPRYALLRNNLALYSAYAGDAETAEKEARAAQQLTPTYEKAHVALAFANLASGKLAEAAATYKGLEKIGARGASYANAGMADLALYEGRFAEAARLLEAGSASDLAGKTLEMAAAKLAVLAHVEVLRGRKPAALLAADRALSLSKIPKIQFLAAQTFAALGEAAKARALASTLSGHYEAEPQAYAKIIEGELALRDRNGAQAVNLLTQANQLVDTWIGRFELGRAYLEAGAFTEADSEFDRCLRRRCETLALFLDEVPTYGYFPPVYYYIGRVREGLKTAGFAEFYKTYIGIRGKTGEDPLLADIQRRIGQ